MFRTVSGDNETTIAALNIIIIQLQIGKGSGYRNKFHTPIIIFVFEFEMNKLLSN